MKRILIKTGVFLLTFLLTLLVAGKIMNRDNHSMTRAMGEATLPVLLMEKDGMYYNEIHGIIGEADVTYQRDTITVLGENRELDFKIDTYGTNVEELSIQVRSCDGSRLIEDTRITEYTEQRNEILVHTSLKDLIESDKEYALVILLKDDKDREIRYFTRIIRDKKLYAAEKLAYVKDFHEKTFSEEGLEELVKYMESNRQGDNTTLHKVNIHSSMSQLGWGELDVRPVFEPVINMKEIAGQTASLELKCIVASGEGKNSIYYVVKEFYRIRYTSDRVYLLDFERTMTQIPGIQSDIYGNNKILLGIVKEDIPLVESEDGNIVVFEVANRLCSYNITTNKLALLFSFYDTESDIRSLYDKHSIKILDVDEGGNVQFAVYGYMNRGRHEGEIGIQLYSYNSKMNTIEESVYIPYDKSYDILECEIENLLYLNREGMLYLYLNRAIYGVNTQEKTAEVLAVTQEDDSVEISGNHKLAAWHMQNHLCLMNLSTQKKSAILAQEGETHYPLGFMGEDMIYGTAKDEDVTVDAMGHRFIPMYKVTICNAEGQVLKVYEQENIYVLSCTIVDNQITLERVQRTEKGEWKEITQDHIMNNVKAAVGKNKITVVAVDIYEKIVQIELKNNINEKTIQILTPQEVVFEGARETVLEPVRETSLYYVYDGKGVAEICCDPANALRTAYELSGTVVDETGQTVWIKGNRVTRNQIMAIREQKVTGEKNSLAVCLDTILKFEGITLDTEKLLAQEKTAFEILEDNLTEDKVADLTGCNLDTVLFFVNQDIPVLASLNDGTAVLVVGFNQYNIVVMDPVKGKLEYKGMNDSAKWFEENGNQFVTYFRTEQ